MVLLCKIKNPTLKYITYLGKDLVPRIMGGGFIPPTILPEGVNFSQKYFYLIDGIIPPKLTFWHYIRGDTGGGGPHRGGYTPPQGREYVSNLSTLPTFYFGRSSTPHPLVMLITYDKKKSILVRWIWMNLWQKYFVVMVIWGLPEWRGSETHHPRNRLPHHLCRRTNPYL